MSTVRSAITVSQPGPQKTTLKKPTEADLRKIAREIKSLVGDPHDWENSDLWNDVWINSTAERLGFELDDQDKDRIVDLVEKRLEQGQKREQKALDRKFQEAIHELWPRCPDCGNIVIKPRFSDHHHYSDNVVIGGRSNDRHWQTLDHLYCNQCGRVYYTEKIEDLETRWARGEFLAKSKLPTRRRRRF